MRLNSNQSNLSYFRKSRLIALLLLLIGLVSPLFSPAIRAQAKPAEPLSSNRYLFIVDTSSAMKRMGDDISGVVNEIVISAASGQLHPGDSLGLWTFNEDVYSELPMQTWASNDREPIAGRITDFLKKQGFRKASHWEKVLPDLTGLITHSDIITVFVISTGEWKMIGTPFDQEINTAYAQTVKDMKGHHRPVVTVLQAKGGKIIKFTVNAVPWPIVIPELPIQVVAPSSIAGVAPSAVAATTPAPPVNANPAPHPVSKPVVTPVSPAQVAKPAPITTPTPVPTPATVPVPWTSPNPLAAAAPKKVFDPQVHTIRPQPTNNTPNPPQQTPPVVNQSANSPVPPATQPSAVILPDNFVNRPHTQFPQTDLPVPNNPLATNMGSLPIPPQIARGVLPAPPNFNPSSLQGAPKPPHRLPVPPSLDSIKSNTANGTVSVSTNSLAARALAFISPSLTGRSNTFLVSGVILILVAMLLIILMVRRARSAPAGPSLITESMNQPKK